MTAKISDQEFDLLRGYIEEQCGIALGDEKAYLIETRLTKLMIENGCENFMEFYQLVKKDPRSALRDKIVDAMTTNETLWFRDVHPFTILKEKMLPAFADEVKAGRRTPIRIWSAASSTGQELYSTAITIHEYCRTQTTLKPSHFELLGTDISPSALFIATAARYDQIAVNRGLPQDVRDRYFTQDGRVWKLNDEIRTMPTFKKFNLQDSPMSLGRFDLVFLRYVAIYFSDDFKKKIFSGLSRVLSPSGHLIIGAVESLRGYSEAFDLLSHAGGSYYKCKS
jgi:chemotaxis protein methyltransferase CheR